MRAVRAAVGAAVLLAVAGTGCRPAEEGTGGTASPAPPPPTEVAPPAAAEAAPRVRRVEAALAPGQPYEGSLAAGERHRFPLHLAAGDYLQAVVHQEGADVELVLVDPAGEDRIVMDSPTGGWGPERVAVVSSRGGLHFLEVRPWSFTAGRYRLEVEARRPATDADLLRARGYRRFVEALASGGAAPSLEALAEAGGLWQRSGHVYGQAIAAYERAILLERSGSPERALEALTAALPLLSEAGLTIYRANVHHLSGDLYLARERNRAAADHYEAAVELRRQIGDRLALAKTLGQLGVALGRLARTGVALRAHGESLELWSSLERSDGLAGAFRGRAQVLLEAGRYDEAQADLEASLELARREGHGYEMADALLGLAQLHARRSLAPSRSDQARANEGALRQALALYDQALQAIGEMEEGKRLRATTLIEIARCRIRLAEGAEAREALLAAREDFIELGSRRDQGLIELELGTLALQAGEPEEAEVHFRRSLPHFDAVDAPQDRASALGWWARSRWQGGDLEGADRLFGEAVASLEELSDRPQDYLLQASFLAPRQNFFELYVDLLLDRHAEDPAGDFAARALEIHERSRARALLQGLAAGGGSGPAPVPATLEDVRRDLLDGDSVLLEIRLGEGASFLWAVTRQRMEVVELPGRERLDGLTRRALALLTEHPGRQGHHRLATVLSELSEVLLAPVGYLLQPGVRLLVVSSGSLQYLPFAALPHPSRGDPLLVDHEVVHLPSASVLLSLRRHGAQRRPPEGLVAVVYDPVYQETDPRLAGVGGGDAQGGVSYPRLLHSRREAAALAALLPPGAVFLASGFSAHRQLLSGGGLNGYRILHLATHGELSGEEPRLVFSKFDADGRSRPAFVTPGEVADLELAADLVVLSGCRTALGEDLRGEGLVGLPQAFFRAGASRLLVSLWGVEDEVASALMSRFYRHLLGGATPAGALRRAQLELRAEPAWKAVHHWAPFVLQGDWRALDSLPSGPGETVRNPRR